MKKVLILGNKLSRGGAESIMVSQVKVLVGSGYDVYLGLLRPTNKPAFYSDLPISEAKVIHLGFTNLFNIRGFFNLLVFLYRNRPGILITHLFESNLIGRLATFFVKVPMIISTEHSIYKNKKRWQISCDKFLSQRTSLIVAVSREVKEFASAQASIPSDKFIVLKQLVDHKLSGKFTRQEIRQRFSVPEQNRVVLFIGRFSPEKGVLKIPIIAEQCRVKMGSKTPTFIIVGYGPLEEQIKKDIADKNLSDFVFVVSDPVYAKEYLAGGDIFLLPSDREGMPLAMIEAMACGLPPVASSVGGVPELVNSINGILVRPDDIGGFSIAIENLLTDSNHLAQTSMVAQKDAIDYAKAAEKDFLRYLRDFLPIRK